MASQGSSQMMTPVEHVALARLLYEAIIRGTDNTEALSWDVLWALRPKTAEVYISAVEMMYQELVALQLKRQEKVRAMVTLEPGQFVLKSQTLDFTRKPPKK